MVWGDSVEKVKLQLELVNGVLSMLRQRLKGGEAVEGRSGGEVIDVVASPLRALRGVQRNQQFPKSPEIGLALNRLPGMPSFYSGLPAIPPMPMSWWSCRRCCRPEAHWASTLCPGEKTRPCVCTRPTAFAKCCRLWAG